MCDTENGFAESKISLDNLAIDHFSVVNGGLYGTPLISPTLIGDTASLNQLDNGELVNALSKDVDLNAQKQIAELATGQAVQMTDGQSVCNSELVSELVNNHSSNHLTNSVNNLTNSHLTNNHLTSNHLTNHLANNQLASNQLANNHLSHNVMHSTTNSASNNSTGFVPDSVQSMLKQQDAGQEEPGARESTANASLTTSTGNNLPACNEAGTQCATNGGSLTNGGACSDTGRLVACTKPNEPSNTESASPTTKSTESSSPAETPKRLHVSNIPFKYHDENLRQLFSVS